MKVVLASGSKQRRDILDLIGIKYDVIKSGIEEESNEKLPDKYVMELSLNKASSVLSKLKEKAIVIACDTIIYMDKKYEKPKTKKEAYNNIIKMRGKVTKAYTGVTIIDMYNNKTISYCDTAELKLRNDILDEEIKWYVDNEKNVLDRCGYTILGKGIIFIESVKGDYNTIFGLSASSLIKHLKLLGYSIKDFELQNK